MRMPTLSIVQRALVCAMACLAIGCGPDRPHMVPVHGTITFDGQPPPTDGAIYFAPLEVADGGARRPGRAMFDTSGRYRATSFETADGLVPGTYRVRVECWKTLPAMGRGGESYVPEGFELPDLTIPADARQIEHDVDIPAAPSR